MLLTLGLVYRAASALHQCFQFSVAGRRSGREYSLIRWSLLLLMSASLTGFSAAQAGPTTDESAPRPALFQTLQRAAPDLAPQVLTLALGALQCARAHGEDGASQRLAVIDYSRPSTQKRLWVFDLRQPRLLFHELVAHGRNTGDNLAESFSNELGSLKTSLGLFRTQQTYQGRHGYSLRLEGLEPGFNDRAMERAIVMHGAPYVDATLSRQQGRLGRSWGCPAVRNGVARPMIDSLKGGQFLFSYYPDPRWLTTSRFLHCEPQISALSKRTAADAS